ncbi:IS200/IS605 family transposase [Pontibacter diazotrophicus]|uniref:IS200/IS605 family transposase n=1 Tax=Pontibacter diazotrophicus TaxID=1400979 RepID=A0A3D8LDR9_9BACT|nr:IS200/IS605 family transposase [Pontibacter diazotrophicus]RDV15446.1 IS200/IS605 family transposase [Pontibacter diazotrophicus]
MANTYTQLYIQIVFAVKGRENLISKEHKEELQKYITGIVQQRNCKLIAIHCMPDHCHILVGLRPDIPLSDLVRDIKANSSKFIKDKEWVRGNFEWQEGFGAFSYAHSQLQDVIQYILNQEEHHKKRTFKEEYLAFLEKFEVEYNEKYLFS